MSANTQLEHWNGPAGQKWVSYAAALDDLFAPLSSKLLETVAVQEGERILDIGCGSGAMTLEANRLAGERVSATGVDISAPLIQLAKDRAAAHGSPATFELADATTYRAAQKYDLVISRLGVMFFNDPVAAFSQIRKQAKSGGGLTFICWQALSANEWLSIPLQAAMPYFNETPQASAPNAPGPFSLAGKDQIAGLLSQSGWRDVSISALELPLTMPGEDANSSARLMIQMGPIAPIVQSQNLESEPIELAVTQALKERTQPNGGIVMNSACWLVSASTV